jgi:phosphatidylserine/phosphatidylglycerophosphate/cardiolipin synthase-like enzyme
MSPARAAKTAADAKPKPFEWNELHQFKAEGRFLDGYPSDTRTFFAPRDDLHGLLRSLLASAQHSIVINMFGYADDELDEIVRGKLASRHIYVQMSLDRTQAAGVHERNILGQWENDDFGNSIAIGTSAKSAISHLKICIVDGVYTIRGSTNWSLSGEQKQDNELTLSRNAVIAAETRAVLDMNHDWMLKQMAKRRAEGKSTGEPGSGPGKGRKFTRSTTPRAKPRARPAR